MDPYILDHIKQVYDQIDIASLSILFQPCPIIIPIVFPKFTQADHQNIQIYQECKSILFWLAALAWYIYPKRDVFLAYINQDIYGVITWIGSIWLAEIVSLHFKLFASVSKRFNAKRLNRRAKHRWISIQAILKSHICNILLWLIVDQSISARWRRKKLTVSVGWPGGLRLPLTIWSVICP